MGERWDGGTVRSSGGKALGQKCLGPNACWEASKPQRVEPRSVSVSEDGAALEVGYRQCSSLAKVEAEDRSGEGPLLQHAPQGCGGPTHGQGRVGHAHDAIKLCIDEIGAQLILIQTKLLVVTWMLWSGNKGWEVTSVTSPTSPRHPSSVILHLSFTSVPFLLDRSCKSHFLF